jgi:hypothetical protein
MKRANLNTLALLLVTVATTTRAQNYDIDWFNIAGGGGTSAGGTYSVSGAVGQPDASGAMTGGSYSVTSGFWSSITVVPTAGVPNLTIVLDGPNSVKILWPSAGSYALQQNSSLAGAGWTTNRYAISTVNGTNSISITSPTGNLFFRLSNP